MEWLYIVVLGTSIWVLIDANTIGVKKGQIKGLFGMGAVGWFLSCLLLWIIAFPAYLAKRGDYKRLVSSNYVLATSSEILQHPVTPAKQVEKPLSWSRRLMQKIAQFVLWCLGLTLAGYLMYRGALIYESAQPVSI